MLRLTIVIENFNETNMIKYFKCCYFNSHFDRQIISKKQNKKMPPKQSSSSPQKRTEQQLSWFRKYKQQIELYTTENLRQEVQFDDTDEKFVAPSLLNPDGRPNVSLLFDFELQPADRRYLLRQMETSHKEFRQRILAEILRKQEEERKKAEEAEDVKEITEVKARFKKVQEKLDAKAKETQEFQRSTIERETKEYFAEQRRKAKLVEDARIAFEQREQERLDRLPDFPTVFTVCTRLHATPERRAERNDTKNQQSNNNRTPVAKTMRAFRDQQNHIMISSPSNLVEVRYSVSRETGELQMITSVE